MRNRALFEACATGLLLVVMLVTAPGRAAAEVERTCFGPDGAPLPFRNNDQVLELLRTAEVIDEEPFNPSSISAWRQQLRDMILFDNLIGNADRNAGNRLITEDYTLMMVDPTRAFQQTPDLVRPERLTHANHGTWERLRGLDEEEMADTVRPFLTPLRDLHAATSP